MKFLIVLLLIYSSCAIAQNESIAKQLPNSQVRPGIQLGVFSSAGNQPTPDASVVKSKLGYTVGAIVTFNHSSGYLSVSTGIEYVSFHTYFKSNNPSLAEDEMIYQVGHRRPHFYDVPVDFDLSLPLTNWLGVTGGVSANFGSLIHTRNTIESFRIPTDELIKVEDSPIQRESRFIYGLGLSLGLEFFIGNNYTVELRGLRSFRADGLFSATNYEYFGGQLSLKRTIIWHNKK